MNLKVKVAIAFVSSLICAGIAMIVSLYISRYVYLIHPYYFSNEGWIIFFLALCNLLSLGAYLFAFFLLFLPKYSAEKKGDQNDLSKMQD